LKKGRETFIFCALCRSRFYAFKTIFCTFFTPGITDFCSFICSITFVSPIGSRITGIRVATPLIVTFLPIFYSVAITSTRSSYSIIGILVFIVPFDTIGPSMNSWGWFCLLSSLAYTPQCILVISSRATVSHYGICF
jgi:hypothetical protein